ncbi:hypothetical protein [Leuconostoc gelidum]|uniref:hypothetical protein n=1 Tax=Leuconostoc gelidum TaxID=1244 RepID=UPI001C7E14C5|nr:hypothetical protein [Leuconostoc gelidum]MBZ6009746.1 hypothetical protein [Leuconostoc gelidum subsp. aenigmaticum]
MPNTAKQLKIFIKNFPEMFSMKLIFFSKQPDCCLKITQLSFYVSIPISFVIYLIIGENIKSYSFVIILVFEFIHLICFQKWSKNNPNFYETKEISYFLRHNIFSKTDYLIMINKLNDIKHSRHTLLTTFFSESKIKLYSVLIIPVAPTVIKSLITFLLTLLKNKNFMSRNFIISILIFSLLPLTIIFLVYYFKTDKDNKKIICLSALKKIEDKYFLKHNGQLNKQLLDITISENKKTIQYSLKKSFRLPKK